MLILIGTLYFFYVLLKLYISASEIGFVSYAKNLPAVILSSENYQKAAEYKISNERLHVLVNFYDYALFLFWILFGLKVLETLCIKEGGIIESVIFVMSFIVINYILTLPFDIYSTFVQDKKFGFSTIDAKTYLLDSIKSAVIFLILGGLIIALISWIISSFALWWLWSFAAIFVLILFINMFYPTLIAPLFNKFIPLENSELKNSIEVLMQKAGLKSSGIFTMDASKRDNRLNAYFGGLGKSKRVVLFDTLLKKLSVNELLAVLGHELGHFKHKDILKNIVLTAALLFALFAFFGNLPDGVYEAFGIKNSAHSAIVIFLLLSSAVSFLIMPIFGYLSRKNEYRADEYGSECESKEALASALVKLADENKSFPRSHFLYIAFYHTHPPLVERLKALGMDTEK
ncbi:MAG: M48 family metallopeptidase [Campylobacteraceae bacterium]|jgi:STE24 endopeptidase|nr:M48 family metallopeptidase [Campylobacteraceae bacterium]